MIGKKFLSRALTALILGGSLLVMPVADAEIYTGDGEYTMSKYETPAVAEERAIKEAMRFAQQKAGSYIESYSRMNNFKLLEDEVITISANVFKLVEKPVINKTLMEDGDSIKIYAIVKIEITDEDINTWLNDSIERRTQSNEQFEELRRDYEEQAKRLKALEDLIAAGGIKNSQDEKRIVQAYADEDKIFLSNQKVEEGWRFLHNNNYDNALKVFSEAVELNPNNSDAYYGRGTAYGDLNEYDKAINDYNKAIELKPNVDYAYYNRGVAYRHLGKYEQAIENYTKAIEFNPNNAKAYTNRGMAYHHFCKYEEAINDYTKALEIYPNDAKAYYNRGLANRHLDKYEQAIDDYTKSIEFNPKDASAYYNRGIANRHLGNYEQAISDYTKAIQLNPTDEYAYYNRGTVYTLLDNHKQAILDFTRVIQLNPKDAAAYYNRGVAYQRLGDNKSAEADFEKAEQLGKSQ